MEFFTINNNYILQNSQGYQPDSFLAYYYMIEGSLILHPGVEAT